MLQPGQDDERCGSARVDHERHRAAIPGSRIGVGARENRRHGGIRERVLEVREQVVRSAGRMPLRCERGTGEPALLEEVTVDALLLQVEPLVQTAGDEPYEADLRGDQPQLVGEHLEVLGAEAVNGRRCQHHMPLRAEGIAALEFDHQAARLSARSAHLRGITVAIGLEPMAAPSGAALFDDARARGTGDQVALGLARCRIVAHFENTRIGVHFLRTDAQRPLPRQSFRIHVAEQHEHARRDHCCRDQPREQPHAPAINGSAHR